MEDINFKKFICYILNCIGAAESDVANKRNILYINDELKKVSYNGTNSRINFKKLDYAYKDIGGIPNYGAIIDAGQVTDLEANDVGKPYTILNNNINNIKQYFNVKQLPKYIVLDDDNPIQLNVARSIHQAFDLINVSFDAKSWYLKQYRDLQNPISRSGIIFNSDNKRKFYGGTKIEYKDDNKEVNGITYDQLLSNVLKDIIYMITDETEEIKDFDVITLYILSKINYYLAKRYAVLSLDNSKGKLHKALEEYAKITEYDTNFFNNFTYYNKEEIDNTDFPRYYQREILKLFNAGRSTDKDNDISSYLLATENNENIRDVIDNESFNDFTKYYNYLTQYKSYFENNTQYTNTYITFVSDYELINNIRKCIIEISQQRQKIVKDVVVAAADAASVRGVDDANAPTIATKTAEDEYIKYFTIVTNEYEFSSYNNEIKNAIHKFAAAAADAARAAKVNAAGDAAAAAAAARAADDAAVDAAANVDAVAIAAAGAAVDTAVGAAGADYTKIDEYIRNIIIKYNKKIIQKAEDIESSIDNNKCIKLKIKTNINDNMIKKINEIKKYYIPMLFKTIKPYIKKYSNNTFSSVYKSPTISYTVTPMNIRPLIDKRATETDLSNYAAQIASDSFLHSNKLPALPEVTTLNNTSRLFEMVGGSTNINNSSNVYRTIFNSILNTLNSKKIRLNERDREKVDKSLDNLEQTEQYLKSTLSDYAKYASATKEKGKEISYAEVQKFVNNYENKLREYNQNSAHMLKFIGKLTRYLIVK